MRLHAMTGREQAIAEYPVLVNASYAEPGADLAIARYIKWDLVRYAEPTIAKCAEPAIGEYAEPAIARYTEPASAECAE